MLQAYMQQDYYLNYLLNDSSASAVVPEPEKAKIHSIEFHGAVESLRIVSRYASWLADRASVSDPRFFAEHVGRTHESFAPAAIYRAIGNVMEESENETLSPATAAECIEHMYEFDRFVKNGLPRFDRFTTKYVEWLRLYADNFIVLSEACGKEKTRKALTQTVFDEMNSTYGPALTAVDGEEMAL